MKENTKQKIMRRITFIIKQIKNKTLDSLKFCEEKNYGNLFYILNFFYFIIGYLIHAIV